MEILNMTTKTKKKKSCCGNTQSCTTDSNVTQIQVDLEKATWFIGGLISGIVISIIATLIIL